MVKRNPAYGRIVPSRADHVATETNPAYGHVHFSSSRPEKDEEEENHTYEPIPYDQPGH